MAYPTGGAQWPPPAPPGPTGPSPWPPPGTPVAPLSLEGANRAHRWFVVYVVAMMLLYLGLLAVGLFLLLYDFTDVTDVDELRFQGGAFLVMGFALLAVHAVGLFLPRRPWGWVYGLVLIGLGLTSCITWPATIPLIIAWLKPEMKARFRST